MTSDEQTSMSCALPDLIQPALCILPSPADLQAQLKGCVASAAKALLHMRATLTDHARLVAVAAAAEPAQDRRHTLQAAHTALEQGLQAAHLACADLSRHMQVLVRNARLLCNTVCRLCC